MMTPSQACHEITVSCRFAFSFHFSFIHFIPTLFPPGAESRLTPPESSQYRVQHSAPKITSPDWPLGQPPSHTPPHTDTFSMRCVAIRHDASMHIRGRIVTDCNGTDEKRIRVVRTTAGPSPPEGEVRSGPVTTRPRARERRVHTSGNMPNRECTK